MVECIKGGGIGKWYLLMRTLIDVYMFWESGDEGVLERIIFLRISILGFIFIYLFIFFFNVLDFLCSLFLRRDGAHNQPQHNGRMTELD